MRKSSPGFTLVELLVAIAASTIVVAAAASFMLFGLRMEKASTDDAALQSNSRIILRVLENIAAEMSVTEVKPTDDYIDENGEKKYSSWELYATNAIGEKTECVLSFDNAEQAIIGKDGAKIIEDIASSTISYENRILKCEITTTSEEKYSASVYCRLGSGEIVLTEIEQLGKSQIDAVLLEALKKAAEDAAKFEAELPARQALLTTLLDQYGSTGRIYDNTIFNGYEFATWYWANTSRDENSEWAKEPETIPWCALFVSWGLNKSLEAEHGTSKYQLLSPSVDTMMWFQFDRESNSDACVDPENNKKYDFTILGNQAAYNDIKEDYNTFGEWHYPYDEDGDEWLPNPGDLVFFENLEGNERADHVGVVLYVMEETPISDKDGNVIGKTPKTIYTIEGNHDDRVGIFAYPYDSVAGTYKAGGSYIIGYGVIDWAGLGLADDVTSN